MTEELKGFYDEAYTDERLGTNLPQGIYHLRVADAAVGTWEDGRPRLDITTAVVCGEFAEAFGPRITLSVGASSGVTATGREFKISGEDAAKRLRVTVKLLHPEPIPMSAPTTYDGNMLEDIANALGGSEFYCKVGEDKNGFARAKRMFSLAEPPKGFTDDCGVEPFKL